MSTERLKKADRDFSQANAKENNEDMNIQTEHYCEAEAPNDTNLILLCLDYLRSLHRSRCVHRDDLEIEVGINKDYLTLAIWAMSNAISRPSDLKHGSMRETDKCIEDSLQFGNDAFFQPNYEHLTHVNKSVDKKLVKLSHSMRIPCLEMMECELMYKFDPKRGELASAEKVNLESDEETEENESYSCGVSKALMSCESSLNPHRTTWYEYEDNHYSNQYRFYDTMGFSSNLPLTLPHIVTKGITSLRAKSRLQAEENMMTGELFANFVDSVSKNGIFNISDREIMNHPDFKDEMTEDEIIEINDQIHEHRFRKVVTKYRTKLASKYQEQNTEHKLDDLLDFDQIDMNAVVDTQIDNDDNDNINLQKKMNQQKEKNLVLLIGGDNKKNKNKQDSSGIVNKHFDIASKLKESNEEIINQLDDDVTLVAESVFGEIGSVVANHREAADSCSKTSTVSNVSQHSRLSLRSSIDKHNVDAAECLKAKGNAAMQRKKYEKAKSYYTQALELAPAGPTSHVYFSNRAAALLSMRNFNEAVWDAERSIALNPNYSKAYARLGLAHFLLERYQDAVDSYTLAIKLEPDNVTSLSYLEKSKKKLALLEKNRKESEQTIIKNRKHEPPSQMKAPNDSCEEEQKIRNDSVVEVNHSEKKDHKSRLESANAARPLSIDTNRPGTTNENRHTQWSSVDTSNQHRAGKDPPEEKGLSTSKSARSLRDRLERAKKSPQHKFVNRFPDDEELLKRNDPSDFSVPITASCSNESGKRSTAEKDQSQVEADRLKSEGNKAMARKQYEKAVLFYSKSLRLAPAGKNSHVYFSNRAAAFCYLERYEEAELDAERSLALHPEYGKAHARLGLSRYFLKDYFGAIDAYESALIYDPSNAASKSYLAKAKAKVDYQRSDNRGITTAE
jgi:tetratricopeptide (TPR) repeat protein